MVTLDLIIPSVEEAVEVAGEAVATQSSSGNMLVPIIAVLVVVAIAIVVVSKVVISKGLKSAK